MRRRTCSRRCAAPAAFKAARRTPRSSSSSSDVRRWNSGPNPRGPRALRRRSCAPGGRVLQYLSEQHQGTAFLVGLDILGDAADSPHHEPASSERSTRSSESRMPSRRSAHCVTRASPRTWGSGSCERALTRSIRPSGRCARIHCRCAREPRPTHAGAVGQVLVEHLGRVLLEHLHALKHDALERALQLSRDLADHVRLAQRDAHALVAEAQPPHVAPQFHDVAAAHADPGDHPGEQHHGDAMPSVRVVAPATAPIPRMSRPATPSPRRSTPASMYDFTRRR